MSERLSPLPRGAYPWHQETVLQWEDSDIYGHLNNVAYLKYFDTALNMALIGHKALDLSPGATDPIGLVVQNGAQFFSEITFPTKLWVGARVEKVGRTSLTWGFGLFAAGAELCAARGVYVHVYVDRTTRRPVPLTGPLLACARALAAPTDI
ncbi:acyl-CoA thioesterase [Aquamicrobium defluvii]|uniref:Acyl-CoA thioester hydrolase n=1 Tax=Aquamicrobium defluvii TaxID=69279 RepID=A0A011TRT4_9HYPH|nr:thioesterase family protein [Aquamicrobium defluvii]EXL06822.1 thioesterase [Aquamicrobium defluvii]EZQ15741.1 thioesterase [Halopseudomonas bauzanensis]TDR35863.1 acyl-CoA thioester hydrolase [Aquamicrobium defluvii]